MIQREQLTASEFETLCILMAVGEGATTEELSRALGLCESVTDAVGEAAQTLMERGLLACDECWSVTEQGRKELGSAADVPSESHLLARLQASRGVVTRRPRAASEDDALVRFAPRTRIRRRHD
jgi:hypothetical protein